MLGTRSGCTIRGLGAIRQGREGCVKLPALRGDWSQLTGRSNPSGDGTLSSKLDPSTASPQSGMPPICGGPLRPSTTPRSALTDSRLGTASGSRCTSGRAQLGLYPYRDTSPGSPSHPTSSSLILGHWGPPLWRLNLSRKPVLPPPNTPIGSADSCRERNVVSSLPVPIKLDGTCLRKGSSLHDVKTTYTRRNPRHIGGSSRICCGEAVRRYLTDVEMAVMGQDQPGNCPSRLVRPQVCLLLYHRD